MNDQASRPHRAHVGTLTPHNRGGSVVLFSPLGRGAVQECPFRAAEVRQVGRLNFTVSVHVARELHTTGNARTGTPSPRPCVTTKGTPNEATQNHDNPGSNPASDRADDDRQTRCHQGIENVSRRHFGQDKTLAVQVLNALLHVPARREISFHFWGGRSSRPRGRKRHLGSRRVGTLQRLSQGEGANPQGSLDDRSSQNAPEQRRAKAIYTCTGQVSPESLITCKRSIKRRIESSSTTAPARTGSWLVPCSGSGKLSRAQGRGAGILADSANEPFVRP